MAELLSKMDNHVHENRNLLKSYIFHEVKKAAYYRQFEHFRRGGRMGQPPTKKRTMLQTYDEMCKLYGDDAMEYPEFEYWYIKFYSGNFDMDHDWSPSEHCPPSELQRFIFSDIVMGHSVWTSFKRFCPIEGNDAIDYAEFEFWYMRMNSGNFDMNYDRSADPTLRSFTDLPVHIFEKISENFKFSDKLIIRKVCKPLQSLIDSWKPNIEKINIFHDFNKTSLDFDKDTISYNKSPYNNDPSKQDQCIVHRGYSRFFTENKKHWQLGFQDLKAVLGNPKLRLNSLVIEQFEEEHTKHFLAMLKSLNGAQIHVEKFEILRHTVDPNVLSILEYFKPEVLEVVELIHCTNKADCNSFKASMKRIGMSEQIRKVKMLTFGDEVGKYTQPFDCFLGFTRVTIDVKEYMSTAKQAVLAIKTLVKSTVLELFFIKTTFDFRISSIIRLLGKRSFPRVQGRPNVRRHKVPDSDQFYEIEVTVEMIRIERMP